jgi:hypothetical protein
MTREKAEQLLKENRALKEQLFRAESHRDLLWGVTLAGWALFVAALVLPS